jgi:hypothetical protein
MNDRGMFLGGPVSSDLERVDPAGEGDRDRRARRFPKLPLWNIIVRYRDKKF